MELLSAFQSGVSIEVNRQYRQELCTGRLAHLCQLLFTLLKQNARLKQLKKEGRIYLAHSSGEQSTGAGKVGNRGMRQPGHFFCGWEAAVGAGAHFPFSF